MLYESTRGGFKSITSVEVIKQGIAPDGGLFVPEQGVQFPLDKIKKLVPLDYRQRAVEILKLYLDDYSAEDLTDCVSSAYAPDKFSSEEIAPLVKLNESAHILELWHGPTCAFKDMALQILPHLLVKAVRQTGETSELVVLVATSGDTGKAALEGFKNVPGTKVIVFFPEKGVSEVQKKQMITQEGDNVYSIAVSGANFDDAQNGVKAIFNDEVYRELIGKQGFKFSSANSINWGRLAPQIVYYFSAYADLLKKSEIEAGEKINIVVPTGNFGNILAAYYAQRMGLPVNKLVCASNDNNVLTDFIHTGTYDRKRVFHKTISPSMDILISSNLERLLFELSEHDSSPVKDWMEQLKNEGKYTVSEDLQEKISALFWADFCTEEDTLETISQVWQKYGYVADTHTAVALNVYEKYQQETGDHNKAVIASTASPFKFNQSVARAVLGEKVITDKTEFELLDILAQACDLPIPSGLDHLQDKKILHTTLCTAPGMLTEVSRILGIKEERG